MVPDGVKKCDIYIRSQPFSIRAQLSTVLQSGEGEDGDFLQWQPDSYPQILVDWKTGDVEFVRHQFPVATALWDRPSRGLDFAA